MTALSGIYRVLWLIVFLQTGYIVWQWLESLRLAPYRAVEANLTALEDEQYILSGSFIKNERGNLGECTLDRFTVYGYVNREPQLARFSDAQGWEEHTSREAGKHTLAIAIDGKGEGFEAVEARTRHLCPTIGPDGALYDKLVSRTFSFHDIVRPSGQN